MAETTEAMHRADRALVRVMSVVAGLIAIGSLVIGVGQALFQLDDDDAAVSLLVQSTLEVESPAVISAVADSATVLARLGDTRWLFAAGALLGALTTALIAGAIAVALHRIAAGQPFHRIMTVAAVTCGAALTIGGLLTTAVGGFAQMVAADQLNGGPDGGGPFVVGFVFEPGPWLAGFAILALTAVFHSGARLQRDTEGLV